MFNSQVLDTKQITGDDAEVMIFPTDGKSSEEKYRFQVAHLTDCQLRRISSSIRMDQWPCKNISALTLSSAV